MSIYAELSRIQQELKAPKNLYNSFGKYSYRNAEGILEAVKPLLNGLALVINDEPVLIGDRFYIKATVTLTDGKESVSAVAYAREDEQKKGMDGCQITGACSSYARKYALNALLMIDDSKDSDDDSLSPKNPDNRKPEPAGPAFTRPAVSEASVTTVSELPPTSNVVQIKEAKEAKEAKAVNPVTGYLLAQMGAMREMRKITPKENNKLFKQQHEALIAAKLAPDKKLENYTMEEAEALIDAMYKCFTTTGTELKKE